MKNNLNFLYLLVIFLVFINTLVNASEQFNFTITEIEIIDNGNKIKGQKRGAITTNDGLIIYADNFELNKNLNLLIASGNIKIDDKKQNLIIFADKITYNKNKEIINGKGNISYLNNSIEIKANEFIYLKDKKNLIAKDNVIAKDNFKNITILSNKISYFKHNHKIVTEDLTKAIINSKYEFTSKNVS